MLSANSQISMKTAFETILTLKKLGKPSPEVSQRKRDIFSIVVTPDRIPKFFIPSLDVDHVPLHVRPSDRVVDRGKVVDAAGKKSGPSMVRRSRSESIIKTPGQLKGNNICTKASDYSFWDVDKAADHSDPATRAALSLPHLAKITTPYGFLALGEIPNIRRKESLFFSPTGQQTLLPEKINRSLLEKKEPSPPTKDQSSKDQVKKSRRPNRSTSWEVLSRNTDIDHSEEESSSNIDKCPSRSEKTRFQLLLRKHLSGIKCIKLHNGVKGKIPVKIGRTQSNPLA